MKDLNVGIMFVISLLIPFINRAFTIFSEDSVNLFLYNDTYQSLKYYIYDTAHDVIIIMLALYISLIATNSYVKKLAVVLSVFFSLNIISYWLFRETISTIGFPIPFTEIEIGIFHIYTIDLIAYTIYKLYITYTKT